MEAVLSVSEERGKGVIVNYLPIEKTRGEDVKCSRGK